MSPTRLRLPAVVALITAGTALGCGAGNNEPNSSGNPSGLDETSQETQGHVCADDVCAEDEFCIGTQGALCKPLPPPGGSCDEGCELTEHCCNCTVHACMAAPSGHCEDGPSCACLDESGGFLTRCDAEDRECEVTAEGVDVLCIAVALDEDPFADSGAD
jgi:hypothetical protein